MESFQMIRMERSNHIGVTQILIFGKQLSDSHIHRDRISQSPVLRFLDVETPSKQQCSGRVASVVRRQSGREAFRPFEWLE